MQETSETGLEKFTNTIETAITGIPAPVRKNFLKAFGQLCTAAVDIPVAWLEGKATEIRAATNARVDIIKKSGEEIAGEITIPKEYISKASSKYASKIIKEQINLDEITLNAAKELSEKEAKEEPAPQKEIEDDWLNEFESHARLKSSDDMKIIFGKILSGEILKPGTFSIRTVRLISQLDNIAAKLFQLLRNQAISMRFGHHILDARVVSFSGNAAANALSQFGLSFDNLNVLQEYGLIISDYNSYMIYNPCIAREDNKVSFSLHFNNKDFGLIPTDKENYDKTLQLHGVALTKAGKELLDIIPFEYNEEYTKAFVDFLDKKHLRLVELAMS